MASLTIHCPGCETLLELETLTVTGLKTMEGAWRCARQCIGFWHQHQVPNHPVAEVTKHRARDEADQALMLAARARCSWSGTLVVLVEEEVVHD